MVNMSARVSVVIGVLLSVSIVSGLPTPDASNADLRSAVAVSQLILAQQAQFFKELINITKSKNTCLNTARSPPLEAADCPYPFTKVVDECFYVSKTGLAWHPARHHCLGMGGDLATPANLYALKAHILETRGPKILWIGGIDRGISGGWQWLDGTSVGTEDWSTTRPNANSRPTENCMCMRREAHPALANMPCHKPAYFACQFVNYAYKPLNNIHVARGKVES